MATLTVFLLLSSFVVKNSANQEVPLSPAAPDLPDQIVIRHSEQLANGAESFGHVMVSQTLQTTGQNAKQVRSVAYSVTIRSETGVIASLGSLEIRDLQSIEPLACKVSRKDPANPQSPRALEIELSVRPRGQLKWGEVKETSDVVCQVLSK